MESRRPSNGSCTRVLHCGEEALMQYLLDHPHISDYGNHIAVTIPLSVGNSATYTLDDLHLL